MSFKPGDKVVFNPKMSETLGMPSWDFSPDCTYTVEDVSVDFGKEMLSFYSIPGTHFSARFLPYGDDAVKKMQYDYNDVDVERNIVVRSGHVSAATLTCGDINIVVGERLGRQHWNVRLSRDAAERLHRVLARALEG